MKKFLLIFILSFSQNGLAFAQDSQDIEQIKQIVPTFLNEISDLNLTDEKDYEKLKALIPKFVYVRYVAANILGSFHWKKLNEEEQEAFVSAYLDYMLAKFVPEISSFLSSGVLEFNRIKKSSSRYVANYVYIRNGQTKEQGDHTMWFFKIDPKDGKYKIANISYLASSLFQFNNQSLIKILDEDGPTALIKAIRARARMALQSADN